MNKIRILIADDHPLLRQGLEITLRKRADFEIIAQVDNGSEALRRIREDKPDVAILDVKMPPPDGFEIANAVNLEGLRTKIIFLTMFNESAFVRKVFNVGVKGYILKENTISEIANCVETVAKGGLFFSPQVSGFLLQPDETPNSDGNELLTPSELRILKLISQEKSSREIALELHISLKTVENHRSNICKKLGITGNSALLKYALKKAAIENDDNGLLQ